VYRRRVPPRDVTTTELAQTLCTLSADMNRQVGALIDRSGEIVSVVVGDATKLVLPDLGRQRAGSGRLRGLRLVHTHLRGEGLTRDDLTDLALLRLDLVAAITMDDYGRPDQIHLAHVLPENDEGRHWLELPTQSLYQLDLDFDELIRTLETGLAELVGARAAGRFEEQAIVVHVDRGTSQCDADLAEVLELCVSANVRVVEVLEQTRAKPDPKFAIGKGKLEELVLVGMQRGVELVIFSADLEPSQQRAITDACALRVIDRTQLILDIFARRAQSRDGKLQVELAQLRYALPRLVTKNTGMSRLTGGIGGRGPGETKLEIDRRRAKDRIRWLEHQLAELCQKRAVQRQRRRKSNLPVVSIVGYTNAGKSTLLNTLTESAVVAEDKLFATLDPTTRRLRFPEDREIVLTDTVGFIRDLPPALVAAFRATLEELEYADLLLHVADASNPRMAEQVASVDRILSELGLDAVPRLMVLNKADKAEPGEAARQAFQLGGVAVCAIDRTSLAPLVERIEHELWRKDAPKAAPSTRWSPLDEPARGGAHA
jgi:GTP-binding protein HflX